MYPACTATDLLVKNYEIKLTLKHILLNITQ